MTGWNPPALYAMLGEDARRNLEDPAARAISRKLMAPGFSKEALRDYLGKVRRFRGSRSAVKTYAGRLFQCIEVLGWCCCAYDALRDALRG